MDLGWFNKLVMNHVLAEPGAIAVLAYGLGRIDDIIFFLFRFFDPQDIKDELDRLDAVAKARIEHDAAIAAAAKTASPQAVIPAPPAK